MDGERGQATPEYVGLVLLLAALLGLLAAAVGLLPGSTEVARAIGAKLLCAVGNDDKCGNPPLVGMPASELADAYDSQIAALLGAHAPDLHFEDDEFASLPVDFRRCRERACADTIRRGTVHSTQTGHRPTAFTHVVDCRDPAAARADGYDCSGVRRGRIYLQYWFYYPDSWTHRLGRVGGYHLDDWESFQVRVEPNGQARSRASSHRSYNGRGPEGWTSDIGIKQQRAWDRQLNQLHVAAGSHAGMARAQGSEGRHIHGRDIELIPLESIARRGPLPEFAVVPPWRKRVWRDPEETGT